MVVEKPAGMIMHASALAADDRENLVDRLRGQLGRPVWTVHRLDRATSGLVVLALDAATARALGGRFMAREVSKRYLAVVRGWPRDQGLIDHPVKDRDAPGRPARPARTRYRVLATRELPVAIECYPTSRFALVALAPETGRRHQLRRHLKHISHPIIGDTSFGRGAYNRWFREHLGVHRLLLHAWTLRFRHPDGNRLIALEATPRDGLERVLERLGWCTYPHRPRAPRRLCAG